MSFSDRNEYAIEPQNKPTAILHVDHQVKEANLIRYEIQKKGCLWRQLKISGDEGVVNCFLGDANYCI